MDGLTLLKRLIQHLQARLEKCRDKYRKLAQDQHFRENAGRENEILALLNVLEETREKFLKMERGELDEDQLFDGEDDDDGGSETRPSQR